MNLQTLTIENFISRNLVTAHQDSTLSEVHQVMVDSGLSHLPIVGDSGTPQGILGERDVRIFYLASEFKTIPAHKIMKRDFLTFSIDEKLSTVVREMAQKEFCAAIVEGLDRKCIGIFTVSDALQALDYIFHNT